MDDSERTKGRLFSMYKNRAWLLKAARRLFGIKYGYVLLWGSISGFWTVTGCIAKLPVSIVRRQQYEARLLKSQEYERQMRAGPSGVIPTTALRKAREQGRLLVEQFRPKLREEGVDVLPSWFSPRVTSHCGDTCGFPL